MKKIVITFVLLLTVGTIYAQRGQRVAYIDMEYILENVPEYLQAQNTLNAKVEKWKANLDKLTRHIEVLKTDLANEKAILTKDLIEEREETIKLKQEEFRRLESLYFGPNGDMYMLRKQLVKPVQDQVYNAVQNLAARKKYDFVFDKSSDLVMLYSNKKYDISELVLNSINRDRKRKDNTAKKAKAKTKDLTEEQKAVLAKKEDAKKKKVAAAEAKKKAADERRKAKIKQREEKRKLLRQKKEAIRKAKEAKKKEQTKKKEQNNN